MAGGPLLELSPQQLVSCAPNPDDCGGTGGCAGSTQPLAFKYVQEAGGIELGTDYPYKVPAAPARAWHHCPPLTPISLPPPAAYPLPTTRHSPTRTRRATARAPQRARNSVRLPQLAPHPTPDTSGKVGAGAPHSA